MKRFLCLVLFCVSTAFGQSYSVAVSGSLAAAVQALQVIQPTWAPTDGNIVSVWCPGYLLPGGASFAPTIFNFTLNNGLAPLSLPAPNFYSVPRPGIYCLLRIAGAPQYQGTFYIYASAQMAGSSVAWSDVLSTTGADPVQ